MKVFISSPYTIGNTHVNIMRQIKAFNDLIECGHVPFAPLLGHYVDEHFPQPYEVWIDWCLAWLPMCDCVLRLGGHSKGAKIEVNKAQELGIPVYYSINELNEKQYNECQ